uniref:Major histocompatibility complex, class II, DO alpha n=1 Tax=Pan troglodytes TaxID=9598 RepID=A0A2I3SJF9_PANTR
MALRAGLILGFHTLMTLLSPQEAGATKGPAQCQNRTLSPHRTQDGAQAQGLNNHILWMRQTHFFLSP